MAYDWYPLNPIDWKRDTLHLSLAEEGAYRRLNDEYMVSGGPLPDNDPAIARLIGVSLEDWLAVAPTVRKFYEASHGKLIHKRCEQELHARACHAHATSIKNQANANSRWAKARELKEVYARAFQSHAARIPNDATLHNKTLTLPSEPRERNALPPQKRPSEVTRSELDAAFAARRPTST